MSLYACGPMNGEWDMPEPTDQDPRGRPVRGPGQRAAVVLPLPHPASGQSAAPVPLRPAPRRVTRLPVPVRAGPESCEPAEPQSSWRRGSADTLTRISDGIFRAGLSLQTALDRSPDGLRQAAEHTLDLLDETVREARDTAFARHCSDSDGQEALLARSGLTRAQSREVRARTRQVAALSAATEEQLAVTLGQLAATCPDHSARLQALSQSAARHAARLRQRAGDHAGTG